MRTSTAVIWNFARVFGQAALAIVVSAVVARILTPEQIGIATIVFIFFGLSELIIASGLSAAIVHQKTLETRNVSALFSIAVLYATSYFILLWWFAPDIADYFGHPVLADMLRAISFSTWLLTLAALDRGYFLREKDFKTLMKLEMSSFIVGYAFVAISLAWLGFGEWSQVLANIAMNFLVAAQLFARSRLSFGFSTNLSDIKRLWSYSFGINLIQFIGAISARFTEVILVKFLGAANLAYFNLSRHNATLPFNKIAVSLSHVMFSAYARSQHDFSQIRQDYLKAVRLVSATAVPVALGMAMAGEYFIVGVFGDQWFGAVTIFQLFCIAVAIDAVLHMTGAVFQATNAVYKEVNIQFVVALVRAVILLAFIDQGLAFVGYTIIGHSLVLYLVMAWVINHIIRLSWWDYLAAQLPALMLSIPVIAAEYLMIEGVVQPLGLAHELGLIAVMVSAGMAYVGAMIVLPDKWIGGLRYWGLSHYGHKLPAVAHKILNR